MRGTSRASSTADTSHFLVEKQISFNDIPVILYQSATLGIFKNSLLSVRVIQWFLAERKGTMSSNNNKENAVKEFDSFMNKCIRLSCMNAIRKNIGNSDRLNDISLDELNMRELEEVFAVEDDKDKVEGSLYKIRLRNIDVELDSMVLKNIIENYLTESEAIVLFLTIESSYDQAKEI